MGLYNTIANWYLKKRVYQIEMFVKHPIETQTEVLHSLVKTAIPTVWGQRYGYDSIRKIAHFQEQVPISTYEELFPHIQKVLEGRQDILWPGEVKWFSKSSGTTNDKSKFIPVSKESLNDCHFKGGKDMLALYLHNRPDSKLFDGKGLPIGGSHEINKLNQNSFYGDLSAVLIQNTPIFFELFRATSKKVALMGEWESKIKAMAEQVVKQNVTSIAGVPTWTLVLFKKMFEVTGNTSGSILDIWPNLEVFFHGGVSFEPYREPFKKLLPGSQVQYFETYNASEGFFGLQNETDRTDLLLMLDYGIFYEFIPLSELGKDHPKALTLNEVDTETTYAMVISTNAGLWRYMIGDTVRFTSTSPFKIKIAGRIKHFINAFGEELVVENVEKSLAAACRKTGAEIEDFTVAPVYFSDAENGAHEWLIEFRKEPTDRQYFEEILDNTLKSLNSDYEAKRYKDMALRPPVIRYMPRKTFYNWMKKRGRLGGQNKVPRLFNSRDYVEDILKMAKKAAPKP